MLVEIADPSLVERLRRLLPRPDAPLDVAIKALLERTAPQLLLGDRLAQLQAEIRELKAQVEALRRQVEELAAKSAKPSPLCEPFVAIPLSLVAAAGGGPTPLYQAGHVKLGEEQAEKLQEPAKTPAPQQPDGGAAASWLGRLKATGKQCFTYSEIKEALGYAPGSKLLKRLQKKSENGRAVYCLSQ